MENKSAGKKVLALWILTIVLGALFLVAGVLPLEFRNPQVEPAEIEITPPTEPLVQYVYLIIVDGLRVDGMDYMPYVSEMASRGGYGIMEVEEPTYSRPAYARIITGASSSINGINSNFQIRRLAIPTIYDIAADRGLRTGASAYKWFYELAVGVPYRTGEGYENRTVEDVSLPIQFGYYYDDFNFKYDDEEIFARGKRIMLEHDPNLLIIHSMEVDSTGHDYGGISEEYRDAVRRNDIFIKDFVDAIPRPEESIVIVTGDHGHIDRGGHGGPEKEAVEVPLVIYGSNVLIGEAGGYKQLNLAPTICALLGIPFSAYMEGSIMDAPFNWPDGIKEEKDLLLLQVHQPFAASLYERFNIPYSGMEELSVSRLHEITHTEAVRYNLVLTLAILGVLLFAAVTVFKLYRINTLRNAFTGHGKTFVSAVVSTVLYFIVYHVSFTLVDIDYSYSILEPKAGTLIRLTMPALAAFILFFICYTRWLKDRRSYETYSIHTLVLIISQLTIIAAAAILKGGSEVFLPDLRWYLIHAFTSYHLLLTGGLCIVFSSFAERKPGFDAAEKAVRSS